MDETKASKFRKLLPILPGLLTPSEAASEIIHPEVGLQVNRDALPQLKPQNLQITEILETGDKGNTPNQTSYLEERIRYLEQSNQRLSQALYALSSRVSSVETFNSCTQRPTTSKSYVFGAEAASSLSLMEAMKISNELISELSQRVRKSELSIDAIEYQKPHKVTKFSRNQQI